jgi:hypothetical protein
MRCKSGDIAASGQGVRVLRDGSGA